jgi:hypothetical protein
LVANELPKSKKNLKKGKKDAFFQFIPRNIRCSLSSVSISPRTSKQRKSVAWRWRCSTRIRDVAKSSWKERKWWGLAKIYPNLGLDAEYRLQHPAELERVGPEEVLQSAVVVYLQLGAC